MQVETPLPSVTLQVLAVFPVPLTEIVGVVPEMGVPDKSFSVIVSVLVLVPFAVTGPEAETLDWVASGAPGPDGVGVGVGVVLVRPGKNRSNRLD